MTRLPYLATAFGAALGLLCPTLASHAGSGCTTVAPSVEIHVSGFKDRDGKVRAELFSDKKDEFLASRKVLEAQGKIFHRIDIQTPASGEAVICMPVPKPGRYALVVLHDRNANGKLDPFTDGFGFPNNPKLKLGKPDVSLATIAVSNDPYRSNIVLNYLQGFSVRPLAKPN
jgi:uncharacterized protein (DUF2141 family)